MKTSTQLRDEFFAWALNHNVNHVVVFHNVLQSLLREKLRSPDAADDPVVPDTIQLYDKMNSANSLLLLLGLFEEILVLFWKRRRQGEPIPAGTSINRYKPLLRKLGLDLGAPRAWRVLRDAANIRHCLLHANGRVSLMKEPDRIRACMVRYPGGLEEHLDRVHVTSVFLRECVGAIRDPQSEMLNGLTAHSSGRASHAADCDC